MTTTQIITDPNVRGLTAFAEIDTATKLTILAAIESRTLLALTYSERISEPNTDGSFMFVGWPSVVTAQGFDFSPVGGGDEWSVLWTEIARGDVAV